MSILNVNRIQPVGSGQTVTISATNINTGSATVTAGTFTGNLTGNVTGNLTGTASTATAAATAYGLSGSPTLSGITSVSTSNLTVNGNAYPNAGPLSNRNLIINGAMQVSQRSTSSNVSGYTTLDRFAMNANGGSRLTSQESLTSGDPYNEGFRYFMRVKNTTGSSAASAYREILYKVEAQDLAQSGWNYASSSSFITLSFWIRASISQTYYAFLLTSDGTRQLYSFSISLSANTWTKVTKTIPGNSNITINNDNGEGIAIAFVPFYGTDYTTSGHTDDAWGAYSSSDNLPDMTTTWATTTDATFDITGVQLEVGSVATPFEHRSYGDELARCQRYFYKITLPNDANPTYPACVYAVNTILIQALPVTLSQRTSPTITTTIGTSQPGFYRYDGTAGTGQAISVFNVSVRSTSNVYWFELQFSGASAWGSAGHVGVILWGVGTSSTLSLSAEF